MKSLFCTLFAAACIIAAAPIQTPARVEIIEPDSCDWIDLEAGQLRMACTEVTHIRFVGP